MLIRYIWIPILFIAVCSGNAAAWWNEQWQYRQKISFDTTPTGADIQSNMTDFPVLIRLHSGNFNFVNCSEAGEDLRFVSANDQVLLKHHIEKFDTIDEVAYIWVKLPRLSGGTDQDFIWMYFGNKSAVGGQDSAGTFDANQVAVFHCGELEGAPQDATAYGQTVLEFKGGQGLPAVIGSGISFSGAGDRMVVEATPALDFNNGFTFSAWIRFMQPQQSATLFSRQNPEGQGVLVQINGTKVCFQMTTANNEILRTQDCMDLSSESWHHIAFTAQPNNRMAMYLDGLELFYLNLPKGLPPMDGNIHFCASGDGTHAYVGDLDEVRISNTSRSADWIRAGFKSQGPDGSLVQVGIEEAGGGSGLPIFYLATVLKNITLDGWFIIGCLAVMAVASWIVFLSKTGLVFVVQKENKAFKSAYQEMPDPLTCDQDIDQYYNSTLHRIFAAGCAALNRCMEKNGRRKDQTSTSEAPDSHLLDSRSINAIKTALEKEFIQESQRLNAWLVVLTMAITGGPFLGLLGTVWGVMNTFAAMAEAGEANIMAIAPGVASALSTTVLGLIVAIPALFAYNYLTGKIKEITAEMMITVDQFSVDVDERYGVSR